jgi:HEAT repeat protein
MQSYFNSDDADLRKEAFFNFVDYTNPSNYESLFDFLWDEDEKVRRTAMVSLERFAGYGDIEMLERAAQHDDEFIRKHAGTMLSELN